MKKVTQVDEKTEKAISNTVSGDIEKAKKKNGVIEKEKKSIFGIPYSTLGIKGKAKKGK
jgi:hypothetical protein